MNATSKHLIQSQMFSKEQQYLNLKASVFIFFKGTVLLIMIDKVHYAQCNFTSGLLYVHGVTQDKNRAEVILLLIIGKFTVNVP